MTIYGLISSLGGTLGVFLGEFIFDIFLITVLFLLLIDLNKKGMSLLSFTEFIEIILQAFLIMISRKKTNQVKINIK